MEMSRISIGCHRLMVGWSLRVCVCVTYATMRHTHTMCAARRVPRRCDSINNDYYGWACNPKRYTANVAIFCLVCCCCFLFVFILRLLLLWLSDLWIFGWLSPGRKCVASIVRTEFSILFISNNKSVLRLIRLAEWRRTAFFWFFFVQFEDLFVLILCAGKLEHFARLVFLVGQNRMPSTLLYVFVQIERTEIWNADDNIVGPKQTGGAFVFSFEMFQQTPE